MVRRPFWPVLPGRQLALFTLRNRCGSRCGSPGGLPARGLHVPGRRRPGLRLCQTGQTQPLDSRGWRVKRGARDQLRCRARNRGGRGRWVPQGAPHAKGHRRRGTGQAPSRVAAQVPPPPDGPASPPAIAQSPEAAAKDQREARMLVSDLLEIGVQQRKAYQEAKQKAAATPQPPQQ